MSRRSDPGEPGQASSHDQPAEHAFSAELWVWDVRRHDTWMFVSLPEDISAAIEDEADHRGPRTRFGSVRVSVRIGAAAWSTSVFPDSGSGRFVLPVKRSVRTAAGIEAGDTVLVHLRTL